MEPTARPNKKSRLRRHGKQLAASGLVAPAIGHTNPLVCLGLMALALRLTKKLAEESAGNLVFSPLSIYAALALVAAGSRGRTLHELLTVLGARSRKDLAEIIRGLVEKALADRSRAGGPRVTFACGVWHDEPRKLKPTYRAAAAQSYKAETGAVDFRAKPGEAVKRINEWVAVATNNLIGSIIDGVPDQTDLIVASAVYFKGNWHVPFDKEYTKDDKFHRLDGSTIDVPFMQSCKRQYIACHKGFKVLKLRYKEGHARMSPPSPYSMCVFLPDARDGLWGLVDMIASSPEFQHAHLPTSLVSVGDFRLPRFKLNFSGDISGALRDMGLQVAFDRREADLSNMVEDDGSGRPLALECVIHKAVIEVNEEGTEAAAATSTLLCGASAPKQPRPVPVDFVADHPFVFFVIEEVTGAIVFAGNVLEPSPSMPGEQLLGDGEHTDLDTGPAQSPATNENVHESIMSPLRHYLRRLFG